MRTTRDGFLVSFIAASSLVAGCGGGQTGDLGGNNDGSEATGGSCTESEQPLESRSAETQLGFSPNDLLQQIEGTHEATLAWGTSDAVDFSPSGESTAVSFVIECPDPNPRFVASEPKSSGGGGLVAADPEFGDACPDQVRVDCELGVTTEDGGLDENWAVTVSASSLDIARINLPLELDGFSGSFSIGEPHAENTAVKQLTFDMSVSRFGVSGSIASVLESQFDGAVSAGWVTYARWPAEGCADTGPNAFVVDENTDAGDASPQAIVEQLVPDADRSVEWDDDESSPLTLAVSVDAAGCVMFDPYEVGLMAEFPANVAASSEDERLDFEGLGTLRASFDAEGALMYASVQVGMEPSTEQVAALMASSLDEAEQLASEYDQLELSLSQTFDQGMAMGTVRLLGATIPDCISNPPEPMQSDSGGGSAGCEGIDQQVVFEGIWSP